MHERIAKLVERLHEKTNAGALAWEKDPSGDLQASFPNYAVELSKDRDWTTWLYIYNEEADVINSISEETVSQLAPQVPKVAELYGMARRIALRSDQATENLISALED
jgi:hypothetical protein